MKETNCGYILNKDTRNIIFISIIGMLICTAFVVVIAFVCGEPLFAILGSGVLLITTIIDFLLNKSLLFKYYLEEEKVILKLGKKVVKELKYSETKARTAELTNTFAHGGISFREQCLVIAKKHVDIDSILYYADNDIKKILKEKDVIVVPQGAFNSFLKQMNNQ